ncbi:hypothetical protein BT96DRAFT_834462, partial [Gymnopus androsaceus JB14]
MVEFTSWGSFKPYIFFSSKCGYDSHFCQLLEQTKGRNRKEEDWRRRVPFPFTGCLAHVEVFEGANGSISRITGITEHNTACSSAVLERLPPVPLHEHVYEVALEQLRNGASITSIQQKNREMIQAHSYRGMDTWDSDTANIWYIFLPTDHTALYQKAARGIGVDATELPQYNIDNWLNPESSEFKREIAEAVFHYSARAEAGDRFELCLATPEMDEAAHKFAHKSQLILDGTFGVCSSRLLLFIAMAIDEDRKGLPIALFLFSAATGAKATHASYNTDILTRLLSAWKNHLMKKFGAFEPRSCITDTDTKERGALLRVWPSIILLLCKFHLRQCWTNYRKKLLNFKGGSDFWKNHVRNALYSFEVQLIATVEHANALELIAHQRAYFTGLLEHQDVEAKHPAQAGLTHLKYIEVNWMSLSLWQSWSEWGRIAAAAAIGIPVDGIIPTTNHLESFNAILKRKYI